MHLPQLAPRSPGLWLGPLVALLAITSVGAFILPAAALLALSVRLAPGWGDVRAHPVH